MKQNTRVHTSRSIGFSFSLLAVAICLSGPANAATGLIMPIYGNTLTQFNAAVAAAQKVPMIAIINPDDGPGSSKVAGITSYVSRLKAVNARIAGYISTRYGGTSLNSVYQQIDRYVSWYGANGIFLDETSDRTSQVGYYSSVYSYAKKKGLLVVSNPGTFVPASYAATADVLVTYEDPLSAGWNSSTQPSWTSKYAVTKFAAIIYGAGASSMNNIVNRAIAQRRGWVFVSDGSGNDPFGRAPSYIAAEAAYVRTKNGGK